MFLRRFTGEKFRKKQKNLFHIVTNFPIKFLPPPSLLIPPFIKQLLLPIPFGDFWEGSTAL